MGDNFKIREAAPGEESLIAEHFYRMWCDNNVDPNDIRSNWLEITTQFIDKARRELFYECFVAETSGVVCGSVGCQLFDGLYPNILKDQLRKYGYIWGVFVEPSYRGQGIAKQLTIKAVAYLKTIGCTRAILHASPSGKPVYTNLGFLENNEMKLDIFKN